MKVHYAKFQKSLIVEQLQGNYLKVSLCLEKGNFIFLDLVEEISKIFLVA